MTVFVISFTTGVASLRDDSPYDNTRDVNVPLHGQHDEDDGNFHEVPVDENDINTSTVPTIHVTPQSTPEFPLRFKSSVFGNGVDLHHIHDVMDVIQTPSNVILIPSLLLSGEIHITTLCSNTNSTMINGKITSQPLGALYDFNLKHLSGGCTGSHVSMTECDYYKQWMRSLSSYTIRYYKDEMGKITVVSFHPEESQRSRALKLSILQSFSFHYISNTTTYTTYEPQLDQIVGMTPSTTDSTTTTVVPMADVSYDAVDNDGILLTRSSIAHGTVSESSIIKRFHGNTYF